MFLLNFSVFYKKKKDKKKFPKDNKINPPEMFFWLRHCHNGFFVVFLLILHENN